MKNVSGWPLEAPSGLILADGLFSAVQLSQKTKQKRGLLGGFKSRRKRSEVRAETGLWSR